MNERIKKLIDKSLASVITTKGMGNIVDGCYVVSPDRLEHYAELIVQECTELTLDYKNDEHYNGWLAYRDEIKKHFGIE